ncbi:MAG: PHP domain-containing protein [Proteobacteria bacterium]|nr:PHP domain-containing protein [Pseudomonadota bacterium]
MDEKHLRMYRADLHIHTCLSPCGDWDMTPRAVVETSAEKKLDIIAVTDHNTVENVEAAMERGRQLGLVVLPGMEICSQEEAHVLALFDHMDKALSMQTYVYDHLDGDNLPDVFGYQVVANALDEVISQNPRMLIGATRINLNDLIKKIHEMGGLAIAAHIDKKAYSIPSQLGFIPPDLHLDAVEVSFRARPEDAGKTLLMGMAIPCITSSDAHFPNEIGRVSTKFYMAEPTMAEMRLALKGKEGRYVMYSKKVEP